MKEMGWNIWEYRYTPAHVIDEVWGWLNTQHQMEQEQLEKAKGKRK